MVIRRVLVAAVLVAAAACGSSNSPSSTASPSTTTPTTTTPTTPTTPSTPQTTTVNIAVGASVLTTTAFVPNPVTIKVGDSINWVNTDSIVHTATANNGTAFSSGIIAPGASFKATFSTAGTFAYHCTIHPGMVGTVTVQ